MDGLLIDQAVAPSVEDAPFEIVERKGLGHPDSICDAVMDRVSVALSEAYRARFGRILHHNCDKAVLVAGRAEHRFGGGRIASPMKLVMAGQASRGMGGAVVSVDEIAVEAARAWFEEHLPRVNSVEHLRFQVELHPGSEQLTGIFSDSEAVLGANDTSAAVGYAPLSETEQLTLAAERFLRSSALGTVRAQLGEDIKVMAIRRERRLELTVAVPLVDAQLSGEAEYFERKEDIARRLREHLEGRCKRIDALALSVNALDRPGRGADGTYLTVIGTSAEAADSGAVGRGNAVNGLITPCRPRGAEAAAGKNPVSHVGKIYNVLSLRLAERLCARVDGLSEAQVWIVSRIGEPIDRPPLVAVRARPKPGATLIELVPAMREVAAAEMAGVARLTEELSRGVHPIC